MIMALDWNYIYRSSRLEVFLEISSNSLETTYAKFSFSIKLPDSAPATLLKKKLWHRCFPVNLAKFLRTPFIPEHLRWLLLHTERNLSDVYKKAVLKTPGTGSKMSVFGYLLKEVKRKSLTLLQRCTGTYIPDLLQQLVDHLFWFILTLKITYLKIMKIIRYKMCRWSFRIYFS